MYGEEEIFIWVNKQLIKLACKEIIYLEADDNYIKIYTTASAIPYLVKGTMNDAQKIMPSRFFLRVHRSYMIGLYHVKHFNKDTVHMGVREIPLTRKYIQALFDRFIVLGVFWEQK
jgi:two-component system, LytTR family, response regulator LytT